MGVCKLHRHEADEQAGEKKFTHGRTELTKEVVDKWLDEETQICNPEKGMVREETGTMQ